MVVPCGAMLDKFLTKGLATENNHESIVSGKIPGKENLLVVFSGPGTTHMFGRFGEPAAGFIKRVR